MNAMAPPSTLRLLDDVHRTEQNKNPIRRPLESGLESRVLSECTLPNSVPQVYPAAMFTDVNNLPDSRQVLHQRDQPSQCLRFGLSVKRYEEKDKMSSALPERMIEGALVRFILACSTIFIRLMGVTSSIPLVDANIVDAVGSLIKVTSYNLVDMMRTSSSLSTSGLLGITSHILLVDANIVDTMVRRKDRGPSRFTWPRPADSRVEDEVERHRPKQRRFGRALRSIQDHLSEDVREHHNRRRSRLLQSHL